MEKLKRLIVKMVEEKGDVTFVDIEDIFKTKKIDYIGDYAMACPGEYSHIIVWLGWKTEFISLVSQMCNEKLIEIEPCSPLVYIMSGKILDLPLIKKVYPYQTDHWQPVVFIKPGTSKCI